MSENQGFLNSQKVLQICSVNTTSASTDELLIDVEPRQDCREYAQAQISELLKTFHWISCSDYPMVNHFVTHAVCDHSNIGKGNKTLLQKHLQGSSISEVSVVLQD